MNRIELLVIIISETRWKHGGSGHQLTAGTKIDECRFSISWFISHLHRFSVGIGGGAGPND